MPVKASRILLVFAFLFIAYPYFIHWDLNYSSDTALIGLMGKHIADFGERPLYVWGVGYQGILIEAYLIAFYYKIFGVSPQIANLAPLTVLAFALLVWFIVVKRAYGEGVALLTILFTIISCPYFYHLNARTLPNFPEAFLLGGLILWSYDRRKMGWLGFFCGFGAYVFSITFYYPLAILLSRFKPVRLGYFAYPSYAVMAFAVITLLTGFNSFTYHGNLVKWDSLSTLFWGSLPIAIYYGAVRFRPLNKKLLMGFGVGYLPALYAKVVLGIHSTKAMGIGGNLDAIKDRLHFFYFGHDLFFNGRIYFIVGFLLYLYYAPKRSPLYALFPVMVAIFFSAQMVVDELSSRYLIFLVSVYAMGTAWTLVHFWPRFKAVAIVAGGLFLVSNAFALKRDLQNQENQIHLQTLVKALDDASVTRGFADYWYAYSVDLFTNERIILEPLGSNYCPYYGALVRKEKKIGLLLHKSQWLKDDATEWEKYHITKMIPVEPAIRLYLLESL